MKIIILSDERDGYDYLFLTKTSAEHYLTSGIAGDYHTFEWGIEKVIVRYKVGNKTQTMELFFKWREVV